MNWSQVMKRMEGVAVKWLLLAAFFIDVVTAGKWNYNWTDKLEYDFLSFVN
jgi:hypothetical protein